MTPEERELIPAYKASRAGASRGISVPPDQPVRTMAEWEEVQSVVITWTSFPGILKQIVRAAVLECEVIIACDDPNGVSAYLAGVRLRRSDHGLEQRYLFERIIQQHLVAGLHGRDHLHQ